MGQVQSKVSIIAQEEQSAGIVVQATNRIDTHLAHLPGEQIENCRSSAGIRNGTQIALWFMQQNVDLFLDRSNDAAIDQHNVVLQIDARPLLTNDHAVNLDTPGGD